MGKSNLHELCFGTGGMNPWFGTPENPVAPDRLPGGSSSGSAVAVATDEADVGLGTDTGGSVRIPAACCGIAGLKTTFGRISTDGVWPLSPSLDTVGPLARDVTGVIEGMRLLEPGFSPAAVPASTVGRIRIDGVDPALEAAVDRALAEAELDVVEVSLPGWASAGMPFAVLLMREAWESDRELYQRAPDRIGDDVRARLASAEGFGLDQVDAARTAQRGWQAELAEVFRRFELLALPTLTGQPPALDQLGVPNQLEFPWNVSGTPALALPITVDGWSMAGSLQLCGPTGGEELLCATGRVVEAAVR